MDELKKYTQANRLAWNQAMPRHQDANLDKWDKLFARQGASVLAENEVCQLQALGIEGKRIAHLCCNNGVELLSLKNLGAADCVGFDISDEAVKEAQARAERFGMACRFIQTDVYEIPSSFKKQFDLVYISIGCLGWMPDLQHFFGIAASLLDQGGKLFIHEMHPLAEMLPLDGAPGNPLTLVEPYFKKEPCIETDGIDYVGKTRYKSLPLYWFVWTLSDILMGIISQGMKLQHFSEYPVDISSLFKTAQETGPGIPLSYILVAEKE